MDALTLQALYACVLVAFFVGLGIAMNKGSAITARIFSLSWENILVIFGAIITLALQIIPFIPNVPSWLPVVLAIIIKAIRDLGTSTTQAKAAVARGK